MNGSTNSNSPEEKVETSVIRVDTTVGDFIEALVESAIETTGDRELACYIASSVLNRLFKNSRA